MNILFFDTETNGLPTDKYALTSDVSKWPHVVQIAWQLWQYTSAEDGACVAQACYIIKPPADLVWNTESAGIHKITKERALSEGRPGSEVLAEFKRTASSADVLIAHNLAFDKPVLRACYYREAPSESFSWWPSTEYCSMENTKAVCKLPSKYSKPHDPYKFPRLSELYTHLYGSGANVLFHSADGDVECLVLCFRELVRRRHAPMDLWFRNVTLRRGAPKA
jgi:DNA polymerase-3 subunit epsilon